ncbi:hypothetical protein BJF79_36130 [Actinomadura sp. CNU-125]|uniref:hypothetical protein n=1 Tax=Actinomadura sp. CNU-125 TaxID=1904961 RepID=UPI0009626DF7|nr:hypothetical protein [Actinomadura sp. CNU-125]OLT32413.1 hypothetical protein BJF79_36130 [Actinomadura sp. CNU-125]
MSVIAITRFKSDPADADELRARHAALVTALRAELPGPSDAWLGRVDDESWVGVWRWASTEHMEAAQALAQSRPEAAAAFALAKDVTGEAFDLVDDVTGP